MLSPSFLARFSAFTRERRSTGDWHPAALRKAKGVLRRRGETQKEVLGLQIQLFPCSFMEAGGVSKNPNSYGAEHGQHRLCPVAWSHHINCPVGRLPPVPSCTLASLQVSRSAPRPVPHARDLQDYPCLATKRDTHSSYRTLRFLPTASPSHA